MKPRLFAVFLLVVVFAAGALAGGVAGVAADRGAFRGRIIKARIDDPSWLYDRLGLTPEQRALADSLAARRAPLTEQVMRESIERLRAISDSVDAEFRRQLTPAQQSTLDSLNRNQLRILKRKLPGGTIVDTVRR